MFLHPHTTKLIIFARKIAYIMKSIRKYPVSLFLIAAIWTVCLIPIPETPLDDVPMMDKWTHFVMFGVLSLCIIAEYVYRHKKPKENTLLNNRIGNYLTSDFADLPSVDADNIINTEYDCTGCMTSNDV